MLPDTKYNRTLKQYQYTKNGEVETLPSMKRDEVIPYLIRLTHPELHEMVKRGIENNPHMEATLWRGAMMFLDEKVYRPTLPINGLIGQIESSKGDNSYDIDNDNGYITCSCYHWKNMQAPLTSQGRRVCKHIAALTFDLHFEERF